MYTVSITTSDNHREIVKVYDFCTADFIARGAANALEMMGHLSIVSVREEFELVLRYKVHHTGLPSIRRELVTDNG